MVSDAQASRERRHDDVLGQLERLGALLANETITRAEFEEQKARILTAANSGDPNPAADVEQGESEIVGDPVQIKRDGIGTRILIAVVLSSCSLWLLIIPVVGWILCPVLILWSIGHVFGLQAERFEGACPSCGSKITFDSFNASIDKQVGKKPAKTCSACKKRIILDADRRVVMLAT